jgi:hypothetical protein
MIGLREAYGVLSPARLVYGHVDKTEPTTIRAATIPASTMPMFRALPVSLFEGGIGHGQSSMFPRRLGT